METTLIEFFMNSQSPWAILFVVLFLWQLKTNKEREFEHHRKQEKDLQSIKKEIEILASVWKVLIDAELERRKEK
jgi:uncharacterized protein YydD (DUF2326 family)